MNITITPESLRELAEVLEAASVASVVTDEGTVIVLHREEPEPVLAEVYMIRFPEGDGMVKPLWWSDTEGMTELSHATVYHIEDPSLLPAHAIDGEWVRLVESPF